MKYLRLGASLLAVMMAAALRPLEAVPSNPWFMPPAPRRRRSWARLGRGRATGPGPRKTPATAFDLKRLDRADAKRARKADRLVKLVAAGGMVGA